MGPDFVDDAATMSIAANHFIVLRIAANKCTAEFSKYTNIPKKQTQKFV